MNSPRLSFAILCLVCVLTAAFIIPGINDNIDDPNAISYFNNDEGYLMSLAWFYYSGQKSFAYTMNVDYGLEMAYLADFLRLIPSKFTTFTPGGIVLILRWLHLAAWIGALIALWFFAGYHFGKGWQQALVLLLVASRPAVDYFANGMKPDPLALLLVIIGLNYSLRLIKDPSVKNFFIAVTCASAGLVVKYAGIFLLPAVITALYLGYAYNRGMTGGIQPALYERFYFRLKKPWIFSALLSFILMLGPLVILFFYTRKTTGLTYFQEFGILPGLAKSKIALPFTVTALTLFLFSVLWFFLNKKRPVSAFIKKLNMLGSISAVTCAFFLGIALVFGVRWFFMPGHFMDSYLFNIMNFTLGRAFNGVSSGGELFRIFFSGIKNKLISMDPAILILFIFYLLLEIYRFTKGPVTDKLKFYKRVTLAIYASAFFILIFALGRFEQLHMLPFFVAFAILAVQAAELFKITFERKKTVKNIGLLCFGAIFLADIIMNASETIGLRMESFRRKEDIAYEAGMWLRRNIDSRARIVADHYYNVYIPGVYGNVITLRHDEKDPEKAIIRIIQEKRPDYVYYNAGFRGEGEGIIPPLEKILPAKNVKLIKSLTNKRNSGYTEKGARFVVYRVTY